MRVEYEGAQLNLSSEGWITSLYTKPSQRKKGNAKKLLRICKKYANKKQITLSLWASAFDNEPMSNKKLVRFYEKMGFKKYDKVYDVVFLRYIPK